MHVSVHLRRFLWWVSWIITGIGVLISFISLPPVIAGLISLVLAITSYFFSKIGFTVSIFHVAPIPSLRVTEAKLGSLWALDKDDEGKEKTYFGQVFKTKAAALEAFRLLRAWNFERYIDEEGNIILRVIRDELDRYTIMLYPGERGIRKYYDEVARREYGSKTLTNVTDLRFFFFTHADYWNRPQIKGIVEALPKTSPVYLNCFYFDGQVPKPVSARFLRLPKAELVDRKDVHEGEMGFGLEWKDPWIGVDREERAKHEHLFGDRKIENPWRKTVT